MTEFRPPMLCVSSTGASNRQPVNVRKLLATGDWVADLKLDGIRAYCHWDDGAMRLVNRMGVDITKKFPEITSVVPPQDYLWLDGEIVADDGSFETVLTRDKQEKSASIARLAKSHPCRFVAFDAPGLAAPWNLRRGLLATLSLEWGHIDQLSVTPCSGNPGFIDDVAAMGMEGVIVKRKNSRYRFGKRSTDWIKHKNTQRITCLVSGYSPGTGSRAHFGAMHLALVDENGDLVDVGRVGSGFTERQTHELKARLDAGEVLMVEIECLSVTSGGALRFPVYRGIRTDVDALDCSTAQLATLPTC